MSEPSSVVPVFYNPRSGLGGQEDSDPLTAALDEAGVTAETRAVPPAGLAAVAGHDVPAEV